MAYGKPDYDPISDSYRCEICGRWYQGLGYHIARHHGITVREYNTRFGFDKTAVFLSKAFKKKKRAAVIKSRAFKNLERGAPYRFTGKARPTKPKYERSEQSKRRLRTLRKESGKRK